MKNEDIKYEKL